MGRCVHEDYEVMFHPQTDEPEHVVCAMCHGLWPVGERVKSIDLAMKVMGKAEDAD